MYYLGIDLGGTNISVGLVDEDGKIICKSSIPTLAKRSCESILKDMAQHCLEVLKKCNVAIDEVKSIGVGSPGKCITDKKVIVYACNIDDFNNTAIEPEIRKYIDLPVYLENDANCAAIGESVCGASKGCKNSIAITLGTGVGGGVIIDGKVLTGFNYGGGEVGHHVIVSGGEKCSCGRRGCWEAYVSATALIRQAKIEAIRNPKSKLNTDEEVTAKFVFDMADEGDETAQSIIEQYLEYLADGFGNMINIFQPEIIVVGGGIGAQGEKILQPIRENLSKKVYAGNLETKIVQAQLGNDAGIIGAAFLGKLDK